MSANILEINKLYAEIQTKEEAQTTLLKKQHEKKAQEIILNKKLQYLNYYIYWKNLTLFLGKNFY